MIGKVLQTKRKEKKIKAQEVANVLGKSVIFISAIETDKSSIRYSDLVKYCKLLGVSPISVVTATEALTS
jgi:transcriptional regulator with XRE-family HTH domain